MRNFTIPRMAVSLPLAVLVAALLIFVNEAGFRGSNAAMLQIQDAQSTRTVINKLLQQMLDAETGQRGYLLTGDERYLGPYNLALKDVNQNVDALRLMASSDPNELAEFAAISRNISLKLAEMELSVRMRKQGNEDAWKFVLMTDVSRSTWMPSANTRAS